MIGFTALLVAVLRLDPGPLTELVRTPLFWVLAVLVVLGELRPVMVSSATAVGGTYPSAMFTFAVLLYLGLPVAVLLQAVAVTVNGIATRKAWHRVMFNIAQSTLALTAAAVVIGAFGHAPNPAVPWVPTGDALLSHHAGRGRLLRHPGHPRVRRRGAARAPLHPAGAARLDRAAGPGVRRAAGAGPAGRRRDEPLTRAGAAVRGPARGRLLHRHALHAPRPPGAARRADRAAQPQDAHRQHRGGAGRGPP
ncbi:hypothetical protein ACFSTC_07200 [Nonomuraea ferruginea]